MPTPAPPARPIPRPRSAARIDTTARFRRESAISSDSTEERTELTEAILAAKRGDQEAMRFIYARYKNSVYGYVCSIVLDEHEAEDVTQQVFTKILLKIDRYEPRGDVPFSAWVLRVARNVAVDHLRQRRPIPCEDVRERQDRVAAERLQSGGTFRDALNALPDEQRRVVVMRHVCGLTPVEIAERLGKSEPSIHGLHHRGRQALQRELVRFGLAPALASTS